jgi:cation transport ATPase
MTGGVTMWAAIFADVGMSLIVTLNGMRPLRAKLDRPKQPDHPPIQQVVTPS